MSNTNGKPQCVPSSSSVFICDVLFGAAPLTLPSAQVERLMGFGDILVNEQRHSGVAAGIVWGQTGGIQITQGGRYRIVAYGKDAKERHSSHHSRDKATLRTAQFTVGFIGLMIINCILFFDASGRLANIKDFAINFASDILAVGAVLILAEFVDKAYTGGDHGTHEGGAREHERLTEEPSLFRQPLQTTL